MFEHGRNDSSTPFDVPRILIITGLLGPFFSNMFNLVPAWISKHMPRTVWDELNYTFPNFNCCTVWTAEVWGYIKPCWLDSMCLKYLLKIAVSLLCVSRQFALQKMTHRDSSNIPCSKYPRKIATDQSYDLILNDGFRNDCERHSMEYVEWNMNYIYQFSCELKSFEASLLIGGRSIWN